MSTILPHMMRPLCEFRIHAWNVLHAAHWNTGRKNYAKKSPSGHHRTICRAISSQLRHISTIGKILVIQQYLLHMFSQYGERRPTNGWDRLVSLASQQISKGFRVLASLLHRRWSTEVNQTLHDVWPSPGLVHYIYIFRGCCPLTEFCPWCKIHFASKSCVIIYWQRYCMALEQWARAKLCGMVQGMALELSFLVIFIRGRHLYSQGGHHAGHRPTF